MNSSSLKEIKQELVTRSPEELLEFCLRLSKYKKENKELLSYLLFESFDEPAFIEGLKREMDDQFEEINRNTYYYIKKSVRKILTSVKKHIRFSQKKETEVELLLYFCTKMMKFSPSIHRDKRLQNLFNREVESIKKKIATLHEDLQYDYKTELDNLLQKKR